MKIKICGMKDADNIRDVARLRPEYMGFIFYSGSKRHFTGVIPDIDASIRKTGVFVNEEAKVVRETVVRHDLKAIQLHGDEPAAYCAELKMLLEDLDLEIIKVFSVADRIDWSRIASYEEVSDLYLFDTRGKDRGGNGIRFDWSLLNGYPTEKPFILSGGIGPDSIPALKDLMRSDLADLCRGIDLNSRFEDAPGKKNVEELENFIEKIKTIVYE